MIKAVVANGHAVAKNAGLESKPVRFRTTNGNFEKVLVIYWNCLVSVYGLLATEGLGGFRSGDSTVEKDIVHG